MKAKMLSCVAFCLIWMLAPVSAKTVIYWKDPAALRDFAIGSMDSAEDRVYLMKQFQVFARHSLKGVFPDSWTVTIVVRDIDMAGGFRIFNDVGSEDIRYLDNYSSATLDLYYEILNERGELVANGDYRRRSHRLIPRTFSAR